MANVVDLTLNGIDKSAPLVAGAKRVQAEMKAVSSVFSQAGNIAEVVGNSQIAGLVNHIGSTITGARQMTAELGKSKLALAGLGVAGAALGASLGGPLYDLLVGTKGADNRAGQLKFFEILNGAMMEMIALGDRDAANYLQINQSIRERIRLVENLKGINVIDRSAAIGSLERLQEAQRLKVVREADRQIAAERTNADAAYMAAQDKIVEFEKGQRDNKLRADLDVIDRQIEAIQRYREQETAGATGAAQVAAEMRLQTLDGYAQQSAALDIGYEQRLQQIAQLQLSEDEAVRLSGLAYEEYTKKKKSLNLQAVQSGAEMFGNLANAAKAFGKKGLAAYKVFASAQALINTYSSAVAAYNAMAGIPVVGPALAVAAAAAAIAAGLANVAQINSTNANVAHAGLDYVPRDSTFLLQQGERVVQRDQNAVLTEMLEEWRGGGGGASGRQSRITIMLGERVLLDVVAEASRDGRIEIDARSIR